MAVSNTEFIKELIDNKEKVMLIIEEAKKIGVSKDVFVFIDKSLAKYDANFPQSFEKKSIDEIKLNIKELKGIYLLLSQQIELTKNQILAQQNQPVKPLDQVQSTEINSLIDQSTVENIQFDFNSSILPTASKSLLNGVALLLNANPSWRITVSGHTDNKGSAEFNLYLSENRAKSVKTYLLQCGVPASRITCSSFGLTKPIASNETPDGRYKNRRVELDILD